MCIERIEGGKVKDMALYHSLCVFLSSILKYHQSLVPNISL
jgi:hypothetical protein